MIYKIFDLILLICSGVFIISFGILTIAYIGTSIGKIFEKSELLSNIIGKSAFISLIIAVTLSSVRGCFN